MFEDRCNEKYESIDEISTTIIMQQNPLWRIHVTIHHKNMHLKLFSMH